MVFDGSCAGCFVRILSLLFSLGCSMFSHCQSRRGWTWWPQDLLFSLPWPCCSPEPQNHHGQPVREPLHLRTHLLSPPHSSLSLSLSSLLLHSHCSFWFLFYISDNFKSLSFWLLKQPPPTLMFPLTKFCKEDSYILPETLLSQASSCYGVHGHYT